MHRILIGASAATGVVALLIATPPAATSPQGPMFELKARLLPENVVGSPSSTAAHARGTFSARVNAHWRGGQTIEPLLRLTSTRARGARVHIHAGEPGANGPILYTVCAPRGSASQCRSPLRFWNWGYFAWVPDVVHRSAYVDVHTAQNPRGELRGQITVTRVP